MSVSNLELTAPAYNARQQFADDVRHGLGKTGQKELPSTYLYDAVGSALFEAITHLPEYGLTRADERILRSYSAEIASRLPAGTVVAELGSGSGKKTRYLLEALARPRGLLYFPIDVSLTALTACKQELATAASVIPLQHTYFDGLQIAAARRRAGEPLLVLFLGSTIGNFDRAGAREEFLRTIASILSPGDALLLGTDLLKPQSQLLLAYDDPAGVTAAFNRNLLARINRELDGNFDLSQFVHEARYNHRGQRVEMHLRSLRKQAATISAAGITVDFEAGESIWTESSHKFDLSQLPCLARTTGFTHVESWVDFEWPFAENLWVIPATSE
ncbi:MAG: L-histidine N(alpha)-methyltransferase [Bryobacteraceae bacterium]